MRPGANGGYVTIETAPGGGIVLKSYYVFYIGKLIFARFMAALLLFRPEYRKKDLIYFNLYMSVCPRWKKATGT